MPQPVTIPFELHITTGPLPIQEINAFVSFCLQHDAKPLLIELARGEFIHQPMCNKIVYLASLQEALQAATTLTHYMASYNGR